MSSLEERLEKLEKSKSRDQRIKERAEALEELKRTPIKFKERDLSRIHKSKKDKIAERLEREEEEVDVKKFLKERKAKKSAPKEEPKEVVKAKTGRPKKVE